MANDSKLAGYFGYGSLVNRQTLRTNYVEAHKARLSGWRRHWQARPGDIAPDGGRIALLSVHRDLETTIDGLMIIDKGAHLPLVDAREAHYDRVALEAHHIDLSAQAVPVDEAYVYVARQATTGGALRLLQSYLDAVMAGFLGEHGEEGLNSFLQTTDGFDKDMICDRHRPIYPRSVVLAPATAEKFDMLLTKHGVRFLA